MTGGGRGGRRGALRRPLGQVSAAGAALRDESPDRLRYQTAEGRRGMHVMVRQLLWVGPGVVQGTQDRQDPVLNVGGVHRIHTAAPASGQETNNSHEKAAGNKWSRCQVSRELAQMQRSQANTTCCTLYLH